ncbi:MAG: Holliday junction branch migration protein RuvA [Spirochaetaceae bacterium]|jgi:Holliday junction DNA helicase RuvA|nr:Holliday junction branch migration protein RuvA [Spirochaetaceae bacterium]
MFNSLQGIITEKSADTLRLTTGGIEWDIVMPVTDMNLLPPAGETGRVFTWLYHKETEMRLFGFAGEKRRATFLELLKVDGIGPRGAVKILGGISQEELETALEKEDVSRLEAVPGLGKKTAQKMILTLKGKLARAVGENVPTVSPYRELVEALAGMGYDRRSAADALAAAEAAVNPQLSGQEKEKQLFKQAIIRLSGQ